MQINDELDQDSIREFVAECRDTIDDTERHLVLWEKDPSRTDLLEHIFRGFHTLKGNGGFLGFERLESISHQAENLLARIRDEHLAVNTPAITALLKVIDAVRLLLIEIEKSGEEEEADYEVLVAELKIKTLHKQIDDAVIRQNKAAVEEFQERVSAGSSIRVEVSRLDHLSSLAQEIREAQDNLFQSPELANSPALAEQFAWLRRMTADLQESLIRVKQQPIGQIWSRFPRTVRDIAVANGKRVRMEIIGSETMVDRMIVEAVRDPLTHLIRNSIDHGIETPDKRVAAGKSEEGVITLNAYVQDGFVLLEIGDDGIGIRTEAVREAALRGGYITEDQALQMNEQELHHLIFRPGFSTSREVTRLSGRGVGMDVVKTNIENIGGGIEVLTRPGRGTTIRMKIPTRPSLKNKSF